MSLVQSPDTLFLIPLNRMNTFELYEYQLFTKEPIEQALDPDTSPVVNGDRTPLLIYSVSFYFFIYHHHLLPSY